VSCQLHRTLLVFGSGPARSRLQHGSDTSELQECGCILACLAGLYASAITLKNRLADLAYFDGRRISAGPCRCRKTTFRWSVDRFGYIVHRSQAMPSVRISRSTERAFSWEHAGSTALLQSSSDVSYAAHLVHRMGRKCPHAHDQLQAEIILRCNRHWNRIASVGTASYTHVTLAAAFARRASRWSRPGTPIPTAVSRTMSTSSAESPPAQKSRRFRACAGFWMDESIPNAQG
jgi:hypothetical protein